MSTPAKHKNLAKRLLGLSLNDEGRINEASVTEILDSLRKESPIGLKSILRLFLAEIRKHEQTYHARAEIGCNEEKTVVEKILHKLENSTGRKLMLSVVRNPSLISGCKVRLGDDVYEDSISSRLLALQKSFN